MKYFILLGLLLFPFTNGNAQTGPTTSLTFSPVHLKLPFVEVTIESLTKTGSGVAGIFGIGEVKGVGVFEVGMQYNNYIIGSFDHGLEIGFEALLAAGNAANISIGPQTGYKVIIGSGFTLHGQLGYAYNTFTSDSDVFLNLNTGWSF